MFAICMLETTETIRITAFLSNHHSETPPGKKQNLFARLTVCTYVWIVQDWTLQQSMAKSTGRQVQQIAYQGKL